uniref:hypothetical protein n=1 Tax=Microbacterium sp. GbtcB4 TaxID=2824749 RepID=UPI001C310C30
MDTRPPSDIDPATPGEVIRDQLLDALVLERSLRRPGRHPHRIVEPLLVVVADPLVELALVHG